MIGCFSVGNHKAFGLCSGGNLGIVSCPRLVWALELIEVFPDERFRDGRIHFANNDDCHEVRPIPVFIVSLYSSRLKRL